MLKKTNSYIYQTAFPMPATTKPEIPWKSWQNWKEILQGLYPGKPTFTEVELQQVLSLDDNNHERVMIITGGNSGIGLELIKKITKATNKIRIYVFARNRDSTLRAIENLPQVHYVHLDLADISTVKPAVAQFLTMETRLDIIIHNAGTMHPRQGHFTEQNHEIHLGVNCIGSHLLQHHLNRTIIETSRSHRNCRIIWVSSTSHFWAPRHGLYFPDPNFSFTTPPSALTLYSQSKAINIIQSRLWNMMNHEGGGGGNEEEEEEEERVVCVALCPGYLKTGLSRNLTSVENFFGDMITHDAAWGAYTSLYAAFSPEVDKSGAYVISFGKLGRSRGDFDVDGDGNLENMVRVWRYLDDQIAEYK
ncbi:uncharacterized protein LODBEIA_P37200 [Lodderomyces beijingensis]|uniref:Short-chain dehydrogenase n=1 Tax=Lodderomyces beijingensis TaxID=1775926 RepID=A0ABP0ZRG2_9ASCO